MFQKIPTIKSKPLSQGKKLHKLFTETGDGWYMEKNTKGLTPLRRPKLSKKSQDKYDLKKNNYMKLIGIEMIGYSNYIGTSKSRSIQKPK